MNMKFDSVKTDSNNSIIDLFKHYVSSGYYEISKKLANDLLRDNNKNINFLLNYLELNVALNEYEKAIECVDLLSAANYSPIACNLCFELINFRLKKIDSVEKAVKCADAMLTAGMLAEAEQVLLHAIELDSENLKTKTKLAKFYLDTGNMELSVTLAKEVIQSDKSNSRALSILGNALRLQGHEQEAYKTHQQALKFDPECYESLLDVAAFEVSQAKSDHEFKQSINSSNQCLFVHMKSHYKFEQLDASYFKIKHDNEQARYLMSEFGIKGVEKFISITDTILDRLACVEPGFELKVSNAEMSIITEYHRTSHFNDQYVDFGECLNWNLDWKSIANEYINSSPSMVVIDNFLNENALNYLRKFCYESKVWHKSYRHAYLGAFVDKGFISKVHLKIADELKILLSDIIQQDRLEQLWAFKYDSFLGKGINVHADFARTNLNFWITPDDYHLNKGRGGLIVYSEPAPKNWDYFDYNSNSEKIYNYLSLHNSSSVTVPYKANRAVLFDSTLFHETDEIQFEDSYLGRRINMTYLFGLQLKIING